jgi:DNA polymerase III epsilon subunit-like protein
MLRAVIDVETGGLKAGYHEILEMAIVFFNNDFSPIEGLKFVSYIKPTRANVDLKALEVNRIDIDKISPSLTPNLVRTGFLEWKTSLFGNERIIPLGHNYAQFDQRFLEMFFTKDLYDSIFDYHYEDSMVLARALKAKGKLNVERTKLDVLAKHFNIINEKPHSAYFDALTCLAVYKNLINLI